MIFEIASFVLLFGPLVQFVWLVASAWGWVGLCDATSRIAERRRPGLLAIWRRRAEPVNVASSTWQTCQRGGLMSASLIGRFGSSAFRLSTAAVSMSLAGSCFSPESAPGPFHHGVRERGGPIYWTALPSD